MHGDHIHLETMRLKKKKNNTVLLCMHWNHICVFIALTYYSINAVDALNRMNTLLGARLSLLASKIHSDYVEW